MFSIRWLSIGFADTVTSSTASTLFFLRAHSTDKTLVVVHGGLHVLWWERHATRRAFFLHMLEWMLDRVASISLVVESPTAEPLSLPASHEEEAAIRSMGPSPSPGAPQPPPGRIEVMTAALDGPFRVPGDPLSGWSRDYPVEPGSPVTVGERYLASHPSKCSRARPLTWDYVAINRSKRGTNGPHSWRKEME